MISFFDGCRVRQGSRAWVQPQYPIRARLDLQGIQWLQTRKLRCEICLALPSTIRTYTENRQEADENTVILGVFGKMIKNGDVKFQNVAL